MVITQVCGTCHESSILSSPPISLQTKTDIREYKYMSYTKSETHEGWIFDWEKDRFISPKGRVAYAPGEPFTGQISEKELAIIKEKADNFFFSHSGEEEVEERTMTKELSARIVKTIIIGSVTINWIVVE